QNIMHDPGNLAIVEGILGLAKAFRLKTVAEGVEDIEQGKMLMHLGCEIAQGYGISPPIPASQLPTWVNNFKISNHWDELNHDTADVRNFPLLAATVDLRSWINDVIASVNSDGQHKFDSYADCKFGRWLNNEGAKMFGHRQDWHDVKAMHADIHSFAQSLKDESAATAKSQTPKLLQKRDVLLDVMHEWFAQSASEV
ncbi:MAG: EAL domain-containing protein, partial [Pontibacterium sp.]